MNFDNIYFHNVEELEQTKLGYKMYRIPQKIAKQMNEKISNRTVNFASGVELRFRMADDEVTLHLRAADVTEAQTALIYFGSFQGGWDCCAKNIGTEDTAITIRYPKRIEDLEQMYTQYRSSFHPRLVRVLLPYGTIYYIGKEGETQLPLDTDIPRKNYLAYGSSITHGSLSVLPATSYAHLIANALHADCLNMGFAGSAHMEANMAKYITSRKDWDFATVEMGVNLVGSEMTVEEFDNRIGTFLKVFKEDGRPVFVTDIFIHNKEQREQERSIIFREIVKKYANEYGLPYTSGIELLDRKDFISCDMTHPTMEGQQMIAKRWSAVILECIRRL